MFYYLIIFALASVGFSIECGKGIPILTRIPNQKGSYTVADQCLCPSDYYGIQCRNHRKILCYLQTKQYIPQFVDSSNFEQQKQLSALLSAQCYIQQTNNQYMSFVDYYVKKNVQKTFRNYQLQSGSEGGQIIWANDSALLTQDGFVKYQQGYNFTLNDKDQKILSPQDQKAIIEGNGPYKFTYKSQFLGFPFTNSIFSIATNIYKILLNKRVLPAQKLQFTNYEEYNKAIDEQTRKQEEAKQYIDNFSLKDLFSKNKFSIDDVKEQIQNIGKDINSTSMMKVVPMIKCSFVAELRNQTEFGMLKAEIKLIQEYQGTVHDISINSAVARIPIRVEGVGFARVYNSNFYKAQSRIIYFLIAVLAAGTIYGLYRLYKRYKAKKLDKIKKQVEDEYEVKQFK